MNPPQDNVTLGRTLQGISYRSLPSTCFLEHNPQVRAIASYSLFHQSSILTWAMVLFVLSSPFKASSSTLLNFWLEAFSFSAKKLNSFEHGANLYISSALERRTIELPWCFDRKYLYPFQVSLAMLRNGRGKNVLSLSLHVISVVCSLVIIAVVLPCPKSSQNSSSVRKDHWK